MTRSETSSCRFRSRTHFGLLPRRDWRCWLDADSGSPAEGTSLRPDRVPASLRGLDSPCPDGRGHKGGEKIKVSSIRATYIAKALVTKRIKPMMIDGKKVHQIGLHIHQGFRGIVEDEGKDARTLANLLTPTVYDPNSYTPEFKGFLVKVEKA